MYWKFEIETQACAVPNIKFIELRKNCFIEYGEVFRYTDLHLFDGRVLLTFGRRIGVHPELMNEPLIPFEELERRLAPYCPSSRLVTVDDLKAAGLVKTEENPS